MLDELVDTVVVRSVTDNICELVMSRSLWEIKCKRAWVWLGGDIALQKTVEEEEKERKLESQE